MTRAVSLAGRCACAMLLAACSASAAWGQEPRRPGPEETRINYFAGRWRIEFDLKTGPGGSFSASETCEWFLGGFHLICRAEGTGPPGAFAQLAILGFDPTAKTYTYYEITSSGAALFNRGSVSAAVWTWYNETTAEGKRISGRTTTTELSLASYIARFETSIDGGPWTLVWEARATKVP